MKIRVFAISFVASIMLVVACKDRENVSPINLSDRQIVLNSIGNEAITPGFVDLQTSFNALRHEVKSFTDDSTNVEKLLHLRDQWLRTTIQWKILSVFSFGPVDENYLRTNLMTPINSQAIDQILSQTNHSIDSAYVRTLPSDRKGLGAVEYLIFGNDPTNYTRILNTFTAQKSKTAFLRELCDDMQKHVDFVLLKWSRAGEAYVDTFIGNDGDGASSSLALLQYAVSSQIYVARERLVSALTLRKDDFRPDLIEAPYSKKSFDLLKAEIAAIQAIFTGRPISSADSRGFNWLLDKVNARKDGELVSVLVMRQFGIVSARINGINLPLSEVVLSNPAAVSELLTEIDKLKGLIDNEVKVNLHLRE